SWVVGDVKYGAHSGPKRARRTDDFDKAVEGSAGRINHWAEFDHSCGAVIAGEIGKCEGKLLAALEIPQIFLRQGKTHAQGRLGRDPKQTIASGNLLALANITAGGRSFERRREVAVFPCHLARE